MTGVDLTALSAVDLAAAIRDGQHSSEEVVDAHLARIAEIDDQIEAWAFLDPDHARAQAKHADAFRRSGRPLGPLHGVPVGIKDIIDTKDMPTENGTVLDAGRRPRTDAVLVSQLRAAGAVVLGKTVTTELAYYAPSKTKNPHDPSRTPGGSSSGSAAAVASGMAPFAVGTQTNGSVIRPASFCGVVGLKPTWGLIPRTGVLAQSFHLDTIGAFGRSVADAALLADCLIGHDAGDGATAPIAHQGLLEATQSKPPLPPLFAFVKTPVWGQAEDSAKEAFGELAEFLGDAVDDVLLPEVFAQGHALQRRLMTAGFAHNLGTYEQRGRDQLSRHMQDAIDEGREVRAHDYLAAVDWIQVLNAGLDEIFKRYDAILTPSAPGAAPGSASTGNPAFCTLWTLCGTPAVSLPLLKDQNGLPLGVQLVGPRGGDARLMRSAAWLTETVNAAAADDA
ncbi:MAG: amidase [Alphaproteobacteria bacterium]|nr:amidase [Alphaproteobacteria bacterium]